MRHGLGLQARFLSIVLVGATAFAALAGGLAYAIGHQRAIASGRATIDGLVAAVEKTAAIGAYADDRVLLQEVIQGIAHNPLVAKAEVLAPRGIVLATQTRIEEHRVIAGVAVERTLYSPFDSHETVGVLHIEGNTARLEEGARSEAMTFAMLMVGQTALVALLIYAVAARFVSRPIVRLAGALRAMSPGTPERLQTPQRHARDEIGVLIDGANDLLRTNETALKRERELRAEIEKMEAQYRKIFDSSSAGIFVLDAEGRLINSNPTALKVIGLPLDAMQQLRGDHFVRQVFVRPERVLGMMADAAARGETVSADLELRRPDAATAWVHCLISVQGATPQAQLIEGVMYDITERKRHESAVRHQAEHDALTGLHNRMATEAALDRFIAEAGAGESPLSVIYADLDGFKQINDRLGHKAGDQVLQRSAERMQSVLRRSTDVVGRIGGDEFVIVLNRLEPADPTLGQIALQLLERLHEGIALEGGATVQVGVSLGIACYPRHGGTRKQLLHAADAAMYEVKRHGKNSYAMALEAPVLG